MSIFERISTLAWDAKRALVLIWSTIYFEAFFLLLQYTHYIIMILLCCIALYHYDRPSIRDCGEVDNWASLFPFNFYFILFYVCMYVCMYVWNNRAGQRRLPCVFLLLLQLLLENYQREPETVRTKTRRTACGLGNTIVWQWYYIGITYGITKYVTGQRDISLPGDYVSCKIVLLVTIPGTASSLHTGIVSLRCGV